MRYLRRIVELFCNAIRDSLNTILEQVTLRLCGSARDIEWESLDVILAILLNSAFSELAYDEKNTTWLKALDRIFGRGTFCLFLLNVLSCADDRHRSSDLLPGTATVITYHTRPSSMPDGSPTSTIRSNFSANHHQCLKRADLLRHLGRHAVIVSPSIVISQARLKYMTSALSQLWKNFSLESDNVWSLIQAEREPRKVKFGPRDDYAYCVAPDELRRQWFKLLVSCATR